jgi:hypothetical protein
MQVLLSQTTKKREEKQMKQITEYELKFMGMFIDTGIQMLPTTERSAYETDADYDFAMFVSDRLKKFYALYQSKATFQEPGQKDW